ncbi:MAG TPA: fucose isomerase [Clostridiales bacterium UBA8960]|jgi:L-fucose mutarotase|nr:fucose isomerase [Clostridiales bacterium UBA8960]
MLIGIPKILSPDLLKILCEMGHGDTLVIADGNFPAASCAKRLVRLDGHGAIEVLKAIMEVMPLDEAPDKRIGVMSTGNDFVPEIWKRFESYADGLYEVERFAFYEKAKDAYCIIATSESALFANAILTKGVI